MKIYILTGEMDVDNSPIEYVDCSCGEEIPINKTLYGTKEKILYVSENETDTKIARLKHTICDYDKFYLYTYENGALLERYML